MVLPSNLGHVLCCRSWIDRQEDKVAATLQWEIFRWRDGMSIGPPHNFSKTLHNTRAVTQQYINSYITIRPQTQFNSDINGTHTMKLNHTCSPGTRLTIFLHMLFSSAGKHLGCDGGSCNAVSVGKNIHVSVHWTGAVCVLINTSCDCDLYTKCSI